MSKDTHQALSRQLLATLATITALAACSSDSTGTGGGGGNGAGTAGSGQAGNGTAGSSQGGGKGGNNDGGSGGSGPSCNGITGTYAIIRTRSKSNPGSCPPDYTFSPDIPGKVTADNAEASGYRFEIGYSKSDGSNTTFHVCTNNVTNCSIFATCDNKTQVDDPTITDQLKLIINNNSISGSIERTLLDTKCTVNFDLTGTRK